MSKKKLLMIVVPVLIIAVGGIGAMKFLMPKKAGPKPNLTGTVVALPGQFTLNLAGGHYATLSIALLMPPTAKGGPADEPVIRAIVTGDVTGQPTDALISARGREALARRILDGINHQTNATVSRVYFTDLAVQ